MYSNLLINALFSDRFVNRAEQVAKHVGMVQANRPPVDELAGVRMFKETK